jgi:TRAP-type transport system small permease protein
LEYFKRYGYESSGIWLYTAKIKTWLYQVKDKLLSPERKQAMSLSRQKVQGLAKSIRFIEVILITLGSCLLFALMVMGAADVIGRYFFNRPIHGTLEFGKILVMGMVILFWAYTQRNKGHVAITFLIDRFPTKIRRVWDFVIGLISLFLFSLITWQSFKVAMVNREAETVTELGFPVAVLDFAVSLCALVMCLELCLQLVSLVVNYSDQTAAQGTIESRADG